MTGVMGGPVCTTSWGWHNVALSNEPEKLLRLWRVSDMRAHEADPNEPVKHYTICIDGPDDDPNKYDDAMEAFLYICALGRDDA